MIKDFEEWLFEKCPWYYLLSQEQEEEYFSQWFDEVYNKESEEDAALRAVLNEIISFNMDIEIIGSWIWCFKSYPYKDRLKAMGFKYAPKKKAWTWHYGEYKRYGKENNLEDIRSKYGSQRVQRTSSMQYQLN